MKISCPGCGAVFSMDALLGSEAARDAVLAALILPAPLGAQMIRYIALFRPAKRQLSMDRVAKLLNELLPMIDKAKIERNGRTWSAPLDYWKMAMEDMLSKRDTLTLPLLSHGYLLAIIEGYNLKAEQRREQQHEDKLSGRTAAVQSAAYQPYVDPAKARGIMPESFKKDLQRLNIGTYEKLPEAVPDSPDVRKI
jgi:hypothetical protein